MFLSENWFEVVRVDCGVASISLFRVAILPFSKSVQFGTKITKTESDNKIKPREILGPLYLLLGQYFDSRKVLKIFMIYYNINKIG